ncbi:GDP-mannose 4,6-dehydratase [Klebsiella quasipneumoniae]|nr:GDP-mannose 4,6-dehydratase [Klebsiella quasipneumoniae]
MDSLRDWAHAKDYVKMQWMMLQQESQKILLLRQVCNTLLDSSLNLLLLNFGIKLKFQGEGVNEIGIVESVLVTMLQLLNLGMLLFQLILVISDRQKSRLY